MLLKLAVHDGKLHPAKTKTANNKGLVTATHWQHK